MTRDLRSQHLAARQALINNPAANSSCIGRKTLTVIEAAVCLGVSRNTTYQAIRNGTIPSIRVGRRVLVPLHALEALLSGQSSRTSSISA